MIVVYAQSPVALAKGQVQRNPRFFRGVEQGVRRALIHGHWPAIEQAHRDAGIKVERVDGQLTPPTVVKLAPELKALIETHVVPREGRSGGVALVIGSAGSVWDDALAALRMGEFQGVIGCNLAGIWWPGVFDAWVSLHSDKFKTWAARRALLGLPRHKAQIGLEQSLPHFDGQTRVGSSGLYALKVALVDLGFDRAVLCGVPMSPEAAHFNDPQAWTSASVYRAGWNQALPQILGRAKSMSGWTAGQLGQPDADWIAHG